jgi:hypothetical protein
MPVIIDEFSKQYKGNFISFFTLDEEFVLQKQFLIIKKRLKGFGITFEILYRNKNTVYGIKL